jgi:hypothetical protein
MAGFTWVRAARERTDCCRGIFERYVACIPTIKAWVRYAKFEGEHVGTLVEHAPGLVCCCPRASLLLRLHSSTSLVFRNFIITQFCLQLKALLSCSFQHTLASKKPHQLLVIWATMAILLWKISVSFATPSENVAVLNS